MTLELIIQEIKVIGNLLANPSLLDENQEEIIKQQRKYRVRIGQQSFSSKRSGQFITANQLIFDQPFSYIYSNSEHMLFIQIFKPHQYLDNSDLDDILEAQIDLSDLTNLNGDYIESKLSKNSGQNIGKIILTIQTFKKGPKFSEKVNSKIFFQAVKQEKIRKKIQASEAAKNIKNLLVNNTLTDTLMTINEMTLLTQKEDNDIFMKDAFILIKYGIQIRAYSSLTKINTKQSAHWTDYLEFMKNDGIKFEFFFFHYDQLGNLLCKAKGEIRYIIFDQTINLHSINLQDKRSNRYGTLMVKFVQKQVDKVTIDNKIQKKIKQIQPVIQHCIEQFNQVKFQNKNNNHILSQKLWELQQQELAANQDKQKPLNPEEKKKKDEHVKFINFLQKQMIRIERQLAKRQHNNKKDEKKNMFLPSIADKKMNQSHVEQVMHKKSSSVSVVDIKKVKFPKI